MGSGTCPVQTQLLNNNKKNNLMAIVHCKITGVGEIAISMAKMTPNSTLR